MKTADNLIDYVSVTESGGDYAAWNPDDNGRGVSFGLIQFNQKVGSLPELLRRMQKADPSAFETWFWPEHEHLANPAWVRSSDISGFKDVLVKSSASFVFRQAQRDLAREGYMDPAWAACQAVGLTSERALAMAFDAAVQCGSGWMRKTLRDACRTEGGDMPEASRCLATFARAADRGLGGDAGRRHKILRDPNLSDEPWSPDAKPARPLLSLGSTGPDVEALQRSLNRLLWWFPPLKIDGQLGSKTESYLLDFVQRATGAAEFETTPAIWAAIDAALRRAGGEG